MEEKEVVVERHQQVRMLCLHWLLVRTVRTTARDLPVVRQSGEQLYRWTRAM